jgi:hypothetical protein
MAVPRLAAAVELSIWLSRIRHTKFSTCIRIVLNLVRSSTAVDMAVETAVCTAVYTYTTPVYTPQL